VRVASAAAEEAVAADEIAAVLLRQPEVLGVEQLDTNGAVVRLTVRTKPGHQHGVARTVRLAVRAALDAAGVERGPDNA
jgi:small conductance mechanosensitive channel